jgi:2-C-methyl-D-erythritol 4-phosphate cytidylyltransferase
MSVWTIVVAAGSGARFGGLKQFEKLGDGRVVDWSIATACGLSDGVVVVVPANALTGTESGDSTYVPRSSDALPSADLGNGLHPAAAFEAVRLGSAGALQHVGGDRRVVFVAGGATRSASVRNGLASVPEDASIVLVHDGARPFATAALFDRVIDMVRNGADGAIPGVAVTDTIKRVDAQGTITATVDRSDLRAVQTPQAFRAEALRAAYIHGSDATDDAAVVESAGGRVVVVDGETDNRKITTPADLEWARQRVASL